MHLIAIALSPAIALIWFLHVRSIYTPPNKSVVSFLFFGGALCALLALLMNHSVEKYTLLWAGAGETHLRVVFWIFGVGLNEEFAKLLVLLVLLFPRRDFVSPYQGLLGGAAVALGFAAIENIFYLERYGTMTLLIRSVITIPAHAFFTIPMGVMLAYARRRNGVLEKYIWIMAGLAISVVFHGLYDTWLSLTPDWLGYLAYLQVVMMGVLAMRLMRLPPFPDHQEATP